MCLVRTTPGLSVASSAGMSRVRSERSVNCARPREAGRSGNEGDVRIHRFSAPIVAHKLIRSASSDRVEAIVLICAYFRCEGEDAARPIRDL